MPRCPGDAGKGISHTSYMRDFHRRASRADSSYGEHPARAPDVHPGMIALCDEVTEFLVHTATTPGRVRHDDANSGKPSAQCKHHHSPRARHMQLKSPRLFLTSNRDQRCENVERTPRKCCDSARPERQPKLRANGHRPRAVHARWSNANAPAERRARSIEVDVVRSISLGLAADSPGFPCRHRSAHRRRGW